MNSPTLRAYPSGVAGRSAGHDGLSSRSLWCSATRLRLPPRPGNASLFHVDQQATPAEPEGVAGYVSPYPYAERLQEKMDEIIDRRVPMTGRFCGFCYGRLPAGAESCAFCDTPIAGREPVDTIPREVLLAYKAKKSTEARWVHSGAMFGLLLAAALFIVLVVWGPGLLGHPGVAFIALIGGGYLFAQLFGAVLAAQVGYRRGSRKRDRAWARFLAERDGTPPPPEG